MMLGSNQVRNQLHASTHHIVTLRVAISILLIIIALLGWYATQLQKIQRIYIPPDLSQGLLTHIEQVPTPTVYTFAYYIFQQLNRWKTDGEQDYPQQIFSLQGFLTPGCIATLTDDMNEKKRRGELRQRVRGVEEILGQGYQPNRVRIDSASTWSVWLDVVVNESINGHPVKDTTLRYPITIVRFDVDREVNPWGLALACDDGLNPQPISVSESKRFVQPTRESRR